VLIEDIDFILHSFRDADSLTTLIDILGDHLELPTVFSSRGMSSQFDFSLVEHSLLRLTQGKPPLNFCDQFFWWQRFWDPRKSAEVLEKGKWQKLEYFRRVLQCVKAKVPAHCEQVSHYLAFISCCYYQSLELQRQLGISEQ
jgi:hypothetical protein